MVNKGQVRLRLTADLIDVTEEVRREVIGTRGAKAMFLVHEGERVRDKAGMK